MSIYNPYLLGQHNLKSAFSARYETKCLIYTGREKPAAEAKLCVNKQVTAQHPSAWYGLKATGGWPVVNPGLTAFRQQHIPKLS